jgi:hypothetical protein
MTVILFGVSRNQFEPNLLLVGSATLAARGGIAVRIAITFARTLIVRLSCLTISSALERLQTPKAAVEGR